MTDDTKDFKASLNTDHLAALYSAIRVPEARYYLNGVHVAPHPDGGVMMTATDGHVLGCCYDQSGSVSEPAILSLDFKSKLLKRPARMHLPNRMFVAGTEGRVYSGLEGDEAEDLGRFEGMMPVTRVDGTYPDFHRVIPDIAAHQRALRENAEEEGVQAKAADAVATLSFNGALFGRIEAAVRRISNEPHSYLHITQARQGDPMMILVGDAPAFFVLMPIRGDDHHGHRPEWYRHFINPKDEAASKAA